MNHLPWPKLDYQSWLPTYQTLHLWTQIVGKLRLCNTDWQNHAWNSVLYVTPVGFTTSPFRVDDRTVSVDFDFLAHQLVFVTSEGKRLELPLRHESVAAFYGRFMEALEYLGVQSNFNPRPNELSDATPFAKDNVHCTYNSEQVENFWSAMVRIDQVLKRFRSEFIGKASPVHFFWGSFDLAVTRFSGRTAPLHPGGVPHLPDKVAREAYSHEVSSCGFWPGNEAYPYAAFYSYAYPAPEGFKEARVEPSSAFYHSQLGEFILPYEEVRRSASPEEDILKFLRTTYVAAAECGDWDRQALEKSSLLWEMKKAFNPSHQVLPSIN